MTDPFETECTTTHDIYTGTPAALLAAGIIEPMHLEPQPGRRKGWMLFMPDGNPLAEGMISPAYLAGYLSVRVNGHGRCIVRRAIDVDVRRLREEAESTLNFSDSGCKRYYGSRQRLLRDGIPEKWLVDPRSGKKRGRRTFFEGDQKIRVSFSEKGIEVTMTHIDHGRKDGLAGYLKRRAEFGLPLVVRKHLSLVWSAPA